MRLKLSWSSLIPPSRFGVPFVFITLLLLAIDANSAAQALPSFARQTGQPCGTCHTDYPGLTPYGRRFKLLGYTTGGGKFRPTLFPTSSYVPEVAARYAKEFSDLAAYAGEIEHKDWVPPISMMGIIGFTHSDSARRQP